MIRFYLVYQAGIANVFRIDMGQRVRVLQADFRTCENFARGAMCAGAEVETMACNRAGDIIDQAWTRDLESQPFSDKFHPVFSNPEFEVTP